MVLCLDNLGNIAHSGFCAPDYDFVVKTKSCISLICNAVYWVATDWDFCNVPCGIGKSSREITCESPLKIESDSACYHLPTLATEKICNTHVGTLELYFESNHKLNSCLYKFYFVTKLWTCIEMLEEITTLL